MRLAVAAVAMLAALAPEIGAGESPPPAECGQAPQVVARVEPRPAVPAEVPPSLPDCWIDFAAAQVWGGADVAFVDVRAPAQARASRLGGALEVPLADIAGKAFLRPQALVLVGSGFDDADLARACASLRGGGFARVKILRGGVRAWQQAGRAMSAPVAVDAIAPVELHRGIDYAPWLVVGVDLPADAWVPPALARMRRVPSAELDAVIEKERAASAGTLVVVVARDADAARSLRGAKRAGVVVLDGGLAGYRRFLAEQKDIAATAGMPLTRPCGAS